MRFFSVTLKMRMTPRPFLIYVSCNEEMISAGVFMNLAFSRSLLVRQSSNICLNPAALDAAVKTLGSLPSLA